ncbi:MAG: FAD-dependent oxidoreductase [Candidatus Hydrogenedentes bacterium]|nr:FAD-dependent oxidoreductase [Candidatus Hydrogenedentota bacterium]
MTGQLNGHSYDVIVAGGGAAGVAAALAAAHTCARTLLVEPGPFPGGHLVSGLPILGCSNALGERIVGGSAQMLFDACKRLGGYVGSICDWRTLWGDCVDPEAMRLAIAGLIEQAGVDVLLHSFVAGVLGESGAVDKVIVRNRAGDFAIETRVVVDCTGDGDVAYGAGAATEMGEDGELQPVSLVFQMAGVDFPELLEFIAAHPEELVLAENPVIDKTPAECARAVRDHGYPYFVLSAAGSILGGAIAASEIEPCTAVFASPTSMERRELALNTTRLAGVDATDVAELSSAAVALAGQVETAAAFLQRSVPGFAEATVSRIAPRTGVRETRRVVGDYVLQTEDVLEGRKSPDAIAKGGHHVDIHGAGTEQTRIPVADGQSYDIPYGCLVPAGLRNLLVAGRCLSSTRQANGSARVMGTCMATGDAAGVAAALCAGGDCTDARDLPVAEVQQALRVRGAILDGTH